MIACKLPIEVYRALVTRREIALIDLRREMDFATGHPLFAAQIPLNRLRVEAPYRLPRRSVQVVVYGADREMSETGARTLIDMGYTNTQVLKDGVQGWRDAGFELFEDVNSFSKAFGELVAHRKRTPSLTAQVVKALIDSGVHSVILDARPYEEYTTSAIPGGINVPGAELVLRARDLAPDSATRIIVNCAGRTRSLIGAQSLINAQLPNPVYALRNGTIGWTLAAQTLVYKQSKTYAEVTPSVLTQARADAHRVSYQAGVLRIDETALEELTRDKSRTLYCFDVRSREEYETGHRRGFRHAAGGQLVQETDFYAPVRGARIVLSDNLGARADMTASWLAQMGWEVLVIEGTSQVPAEVGSNPGPPPRGQEGRYKRPYEGTDNAAEAMQRYLDWEYGLVDQLERDSSHGFVVI